MPRQTPIDGAGFGKGRYYALVHTGENKVLVDTLAGPVKVEKAIYIIEFKYGQSAEAAIEQCREKRYADAYAADGRRVVCVGVNYNPAVRTFDEVKTEVV